MLAAFEDDSRGREWAVGDDQLAIAHRVVDDLVEVEDPHRVGACVAIDLDADDAVGFAEGDLIGGDERGHAEAR